MNNHPSLEILKTEMEMMHQQFPQAQLPPNCFTSMKAEFLEYESRIKLKVSIPVLEEMLNPMRVMQGGFITAAFDNAFGPLSYLAVKHTCVTLDMHTQYIRPIAVGDVLTITAHVISQGKVSIHLSGEAHNSKGKLVATCSANMIIMR